MEVGAARKDHQREAGVERGAKSDYGLCINVGREGMLLWFPFQFFFPCFIRCLLIHLFSKYLYAPTPFADWSSAPITLCCSCQLQTAHMHLSGELLHPIVPELCCRRPEVGLTQWLHSSQGLRECRCYPHGHFYLKYFIVCQYLR